MLNSWLKAQRMPWIPAAESRDCGASAFATVARYYRYHVTLEQARYRDGCKRGCFLWQLCKIRDVTAKANSLHKGGEARLLLPHVL